MRERESAKNREREKGREWERAEMDWEREKE